MAQIGLRGGFADAVVGDEGIGSCRKLRGPCLRFRCLAYSGSLRGGDGCSHCEHLRAIRVLDVDATRMQSLESPLVIAQMQSCHVKVSSSSSRVEREVGV